jgi:hypothetical protein
MSRTIMNLITLILFTLTSCNNVDSRVIEKPKVDSLITDSLNINKDTIKVREKYIKFREYIIEDMTQEVTVVLTKGNEYLIGSNSNDIFIYFYKQVNTDTKKNMKLKFIENGRAISYVCMKDEVYHLKINKVSNKDKKDPYIVTIHYINPENN